MNDEGLPYPLASNDLPCGWTAACFGDIGKPFYGKALAEAKRVSDGSVAVYGSAGVVGSHDEALSTGPTLIVGRKGNAGAVYLSRESCWPIDTTYYVPVPETVDAKFLYLQLSSMDLKGLDSSTTVPSLRRGDLEAALIRLPPLGEQRRIVEAIEERFSRLDAAEASLVSARGKLYALRRRCFGLTKQTTVPPRPITDVARIVSGQTPKSLIVDPGGSVPFFKVGDMNVAAGYAMMRARSYISSDMARRLKLHVWPSGTVIFPKRGGAIATNKKRLLVTPGSFDLNTMGLVPQQCLDSKFLLFWLETIDLATLSDGSNVPQINHGNVAELMISVPSIDDQIRIVAEIDRLLTMTDRALLEVQRAAQRSQHLRRAILEDAFCGRLVTQQHPDERESRVVLDSETCRTAAEQRKRGATANAELEVAT